MATRRKATSIAKTVKQAVKKHVKKDKCAVELGRKGGLATKRKGVGIFAKRRKTTTRKRK